MCVFSSLFFFLNSTCMVYFLWSHQTLTVCISDGKIRWWREGEGVGKKEKKKEKKGGGEVDVCF